MSDWERIHAARHSETAFPTCAACLVTISPVQKFCSVELAHALLFMCLSFIGTLLMYDTFCYACHVFRPPRAH